ncbi:MAG: tetratricopeptide repeat protein [Bacteroidota bacterium]
MDRTLIDKYFDETLSAAEKKDFQHRLHHDEAFAKAFQIEKDLMEGIEALGNQHLREDLVNIYEEEVVQARAQKATSSPARSLNRRWWLVAASLAILAALLWWLWPQNGPEEWYRQYAQHDFNFTQKGEASILLSEIENQLHAQAYAAALPQIDTYLQQYPDQLQVVLAKGIAYLELKNYDQALSIFAQIRELDTLFKVEGIWYLALTHLRLGNLAESQTLLQQIPETSARSASAKALLQHIKH